VHGDAPSDGRARALGILPHLEEKPRGRLEALVFGALNYERHERGERGS
jgi:hypothetical protein